MVSTVTKSSFEIAAKNLGCSVVDFDISNSSVEKGESIYETVDALSLMGVNLCVLRHPESVIRDLSEYLPEMVFINGGEGSISHPTQGFGKMISKAPDGAATQSIDRSSQHLQITQALAKDL